MCENQAMRFDKDHRLLSIVCSHCYKCSQLKRQEDADLKVLQLLNSSNLVPTRCVKDTLTIYLSCKLHFFCRSRGILFLFFFKKYCTFVAPLYHLWVSQMKAFAELLHVFCCLGFECAYCYAVYNSMKYLFQVYMILIDSGNGHWGSQSARYKNRQGSTFSKY